MNENYSGSSNLTTPNIDFDYCIDNEIFFITYPHDDEGWHTDDEANWSFSIISLLNTLDDYPDNWTKEARKYKKPKSYDYAKSIMPILIGTNKHQQILDSIKIYERTFQSN